MLASQARGADRDPDRATAVVHIPLANVSDDVGSAESEEGVPLLAETARRLLCDARMQLSSEDETGTVIGSVAPLARLPRGWLAWCAIGIGVAAARDAGVSDGSTSTSSSIGPTADPPTSTTSSRFVAVTTGSSMRVVGGSQVIRNDGVTWITPGGSPFVPGPRDRGVATGPIPMLDVCFVPTT